MCLCECCVCMCVRERCALRCISSNESSNRSKLVCFKRLLVYLLLLIYGQNRIDAIKYMNRPLSAYGCVAHFYSLLSLVVLRLHEMATEIQQKSNDLTSIAIPFALHHTKRSRDTQSRSFLYSIICTAFIAK